MIIIVPVKNAQYFHYYIYNFTFLYSYIMIIIYVYNFKIIAYLYYVPKMIIIVECGTGYLPGQEDPGEWSQRLREQEAEED